MRILTTFLRIFLFHSVVTGLGMLYEGLAGNTRTAVAKDLGFPADEGAFKRGFQVGGGGGGGEGGRVGESQCCHTLRQDFSPGLAIELGACRLRVRVAKVI